MRGDRSGNKSVVHDLPTARSVAEVGNKSAVYLIKVADARLVDPVAILRPGSPFDDTDSPTGNRFLAGRRSPLPQLPFFFPFSPFFADLPSACSAMRQQTASAACNDGPWVTLLAFLLCLPNAQARRFQSCVVDSIIIK